MAKIAPRLLTPSKVLKHISSLKNIKNIENWSYFEIRTPKNRGICLNEFL